MIRSVLAGVVLLTVAALTPVFSAPQRSPSVSTRVRGGEPVTACDQLEVTFDRRPASTAEERRTISRADARTLTVESPRNGGVYLHGWDRNDYEVTICKAIAEAAAIFNDISLSTSNGRVSVSGPSGGGWVATVLIATPKGASVNLNTSNGPVGLYGVDGTVNARTNNGPISARNSSGTLELDADNGPVSIVDGSGSVRVRTHNGPLSISLMGTAWSGEGLDARAQNGPLTLAVPERYRTGVEVIGGNGPFNCRGAVCDGARRDWDDRSRSMHIGESDTRVRVSTVNGPVSVVSRP